MSLQSETLRYLGYRGADADPQTAALVAHCLTELQALPPPRSRSARFTVQQADGGITIATMTARSQSLARHLQGCSHAVLFAATLGSPVDALLRRTQTTDMAGAVVLQAAAAALLEAYCDDCCAALSAELAAQGLFLRPRFSPGYGDLAVAHNRDILTILGAARIGLGLTDSCMLTPLKSVTAVIGAGEQPFCNRGGCAACNKADCLFRKDE